MASKPSSTLPVVDVRGQRVVIERPSPQTGVQRRAVGYIHGFLSLFFDPASKVAFSKMRISAVPEENLSIYLHLKPEHITSLVQDTSNNQNPALAKLCGSSARGSIALRFTLSSHAEVIGPPEWSEASVRVKQEALENLQFLATQTNLVLHVPQGVLPMPQVRSLCLAASSHGTLSSSASHARLDTWYEGRGGKVIHLPLATTLGIESPSIPPPAYDESAGPSRLRQDPDTQATPSKKRRLESSVSPTATTLSASVGPKEKSDGQVNVTEKEDSERLRHQMRSYFQELCNESMAQREKTLWEAMEKREASFRQEVFAELGDIETRIKSAAVAQVERLTWSVTDEVLHRLHEEIGEMVSRDEFEELIDDKVTGIKIDMESFVKSEMLEAQDKILDHFENGMFISRFRRPEVE